MRKELKNLFKLSGKVAIYIPSTVDVDKEIDNARYVDSALALLSGMFGGATSTPALGAWLTASGKLVKEKTTLVFAYCNTTDLELNIDRIISHCEGLKFELKQEAIALEINGELYFI